MPRLERRRSTPCRDRDRPSAPVAIRRVLSNRPLIPKVDTLRVHGAFFTQRSIADRTIGHRRPDAQVRRGCDGEHRLGLAEDARFGPVKRLDRTARAVHVAAPPNHRVTAVAVGHHAGRIKEGGGVGDRSGIEFDRASEVAIAADLDGEPFWLTPSVGCVVTIAV